jgi:hypothetical protein
VKMVFHQEQNLFFIARNEKKTLIIRHNNGICDPVRK